MTPREVQKWLDAYDAGYLTDGEFEGGISDHVMEEKLVHLRTGGHDPVVSFIGGTFSGPLKHEYGMFDISSQTRAFYNFTFINIIRFFWNKLMRRFGLHQYTKVW